MSDSSWGTTTTHHHQRFHRRVLPEENCGPVRPASVIVLFLSVVLSAILFSLFHYIGNNADIFNLNTFLIRTFGGIFLGLLYYYRGFGIVVISHISYDFILVSLPLIYTN